MNEMLYLKLFVKLFAAAIIVLGNAPYAFMGYTGRWRWLPLLTLVYIPIAIYAFIISGVDLYDESNAWGYPFLIFLLVLPVVTYIALRVLSKFRNGTWPVSPITTALKDSILISEDERDFYAIWDIEKPVLSLRTVNKWLVWLYLLLLPLSIFSALFMLNRIRYRFGFTRENYGLTVTDPRVTLAASGSLMAGSLDSNPTLAGAGLLFSGGVGGVKRPWSEAQGVDFDDVHHEIRIKDGWRGTRILTCPPEHYSRIRKLLIDRVLNSKTESSGN